MDSPIDSTRIQPDVSKLSEALKVVSEELPRLSNLESSAILPILQGLRDELHRSVDAQNELRTSLNGKLSEIQESLASFESRIGIVEHPDVLHSREDKTSIKVEGQEITQPIVADRHPSSGSRDHAMPSRRLSKSGAQTSMGILEGGSGALLIIIASFIPILAILFYAE